MEDKIYIEQRVEDQIKWYNKKSSFNKYSFNILRSAEIILSILIPFFAGFITKDMYNKYIIGIIGVIVAIIAGLLSFFQFQEKWIQYRATAEKLKREKYLYLAKVDVYNNDNCYNIFVKEIENIISNENSIWFEHIIENKDSLKENQ